jgi:transposase
MNRIDKEQKLQIKALARAGMSAAAIAAKVGIAEHSAYYHARRIRRPRASAPTQGLDVVSRIAKIASSNLDREMKLELIGAMF